MNAIALLEQQLAFTHSVFHQIVNDLTEKEWLARPAPSENIIAYTTWHLPRVQDSFAQTWIRGVPEIVQAERWASWRHLEPFGVGIGVTLEEADQIAQSVQRAEVIEYADCVHQEMLSWLHTLREADLDRIPDARAHLSTYPEYQAAGFRKQTDSLLDQPIWYYLTRACILHTRGHLGEIQAARAVLRADM